MAAAIPKESSDLNFKKKSNNLFHKPCLKMRFVCLLGPPRILTFHLGTTQTNQNLQFSIGHLLQSVCSQVLGHGGLLFCCVNTEVHSPAVNF